MEQAVKLDKWGVVPKGPVSPYQAPETIQLALAGTVASEHPNDKFKIGDEITTSSIRFVDEVDGKVLVTTKSETVYELGTVHPDYEAMVPGARERLLEAGREARKHQP